jgi:hypothetical protein
MIAPRRFALISLLDGPYELPALILVLGLLAVLLASMRGRSAKPRRRQAARVAYGIAGGLAVLLALGLGVQHARSFWSAEWDPHTAEIVLDRPLPLADVRVPAARIDFVAEVSAPERTLAGMQRRVRFEVRLDDGHSYRSTPFLAGKALDPLRRHLAAANGGRLQQFLVGSRTTPH